MSSADGPVLGITSSSTYAMMIEYLRRSYREVRCASGVPFKIDVVVGEREKSVHRRCNFKHKDGTSPLTDMWHFDSYTFGASKFYRS